MQPRSRDFLSLTLMSKSKKTSFKTSADAKVEGLVLNEDYLENRHRKEILQKKTSAAHTFCSLECNLERTFYFADNS